MTQKKKRVEAKPGTPAGGAPQVGSRRWWTSPLAHLGLLAALCLGVYANNYHHEYFLDDSHTLSTNPGIRSLRNIPHYFTDASNFSSLRANVDYRPVLLTSYALNFRMGGYATFWWHLTQILLHLACAVGLYLLCRRVLRLIQPEGEEPAYTTWVPLFAATFFAAHPTASGVVNYLSARSSLLTAALLFPAILLYMVPGTDQRYRRTPWLAALFFAVAIFTKVEAIGVLALCFLWDVWQTAIARNHRGNFFSDLIGTIHRQTLKRLGPMLAVVLVYFLVRRQVMAPFQLSETRRATGVTAFDYLLTQTVVWWEYVIKWFAPVNLVADQGNYPVYRSILEGPVPFAIAGWLLVGAALLAGWRARPWLAFLAISALALLSPTSSIAPLAEMLNEHRPYLPLAVLSLCWMIPLGMFAVRTARRSRALGGVLGLAAVAVLAILGTLTWQRNRAFSTNRSYLEDVVRKAPSGRAFNNYGLIFLRQGQYDLALQHFLKAETYTPRWDIVQVNLGIAYRELGDSQRARKHFDAGVEYDKYSGNALTWRAENNLERGSFSDAVRDFQAAGTRSLEHYRLCKGLATAYAGLGDATKSFEQTARCLELDASQVGRDITAISKPYFDAPERAAAGILYFELLDARIPNTWWVQYNIGTLAGRLGDSVRAAAAHARGEALKQGG